MSFLRRRATVTAACSIAIATLVPAGAVEVPEGGVVADQVAGQAPAPARETGSTGGVGPCHHVTPICEWEWADSRVMELLWTPLDPDAPSGREAASAVCDAEVATAAYREDRGDPPGGLKITSYLAVDRLGVGLPVGPALGALRLSDLERGELASLPPTVRDLLRRSLLALSERRRASQQRWLELQELVVARLEELDPEWFGPVPLENHHVIGREMRLRPDELPEELGLPAELLRRYAFSAPWVEPVAEIGSDLLLSLAVEERKQLARAVVASLAGRSWFSKAQDRHLRTVDELGLVFADLAQIEVELPASCPVARASNAHSVDDPCDLRGAASEVYWAPLDRATPSDEIRTVLCESRGRRRDEERGGSPIEELGKSLPVGLWLGYIHAEDFQRSLTTADLPAGTLEAVAEMRERVVRLEEYHTQATNRALEIVEAALADRPRVDLVHAWRREQLPRALRGRGSEVAAELGVRVSVIEAASSSTLPPRVCVAAAILELLDEHQRQALAEATLGSWLKAKESRLRAMASDVSSQ